MNDRIVRESQRVVYCCYYDVVQTAIFMALYYTFYHGIVPYFCPVS